MASRDILAVALKMETACYLKYRHTIKILLVTTTQMVTIFYTLH